MMKPDRIDFLLVNGKIIVQKLRRDIATDPAHPRDIPVSHELKPASFNLEQALDWCKANGYTVRQWPGGARAWHGSPWPIRTRAQIHRKRTQAEKQGNRTGGSKNGSLLSLDFAYDG